MKTFLVLGSILLSSIALANDSDNLDNYFGDISLMNQQVSQLNNQDLSSLHNKVGLVKLGKCSAVKTLTFPFVVVASGITSLFAEIANPLANGFSLVAGEIPDYTAWSNIKKGAEELNPISIYDLYSDELNRSLDCTKIENLHQAVMNEINSRQANTKIARFELKKSTVAATENDPVATKFSIKNAVEAE